MWGPGINPGDASVAKVEKDCFKRLAPCHPGGWYTLWTTNLRKVAEKQEPVQRTVTRRVKSLLSDIRALVKDTEETQGHINGYLEYPMLHHVTSKGSN